MYMMISSFLLLVISTMTATASTGPSERQKFRIEYALRTAALRRPKRALPVEVKGKIVEFSCPFDWKWLLDIFPETKQTRKFRGYITMCINAGTRLAVDRSEWSVVPIEVNSDGNIVSIALYNQQLTNSAIGDLSKLPSTLRSLHLDRNNLTKFDVTPLPSGLISLYLSNNKLTDLDLTKLPRELTQLWLLNNKLSSLDFSKLPRKLRDLSLSQNELTKVDLSKAPRSLVSVYLRMNYLVPDNFRTFPFDGRDTRVFIGEQRKRRVHSKSDEYKNVKNDDYKYFPSWLR